MYEHRIKTNMRTLKCMVLILSAIFAGVLTGKMSIVHGATTSDETSYSFSPSGWLVETNFNQSSGRLSDNSTGGCTIIKQDTGSTKSTKSSSSSSSSTSSVLKIPDYITITVSYNGVDSEGKTTKQTKTFRKPVTELADNIFYENDTLDEVVIPSTLKKVGSYAFYNCRNLKKITIPSSVEELGEGAFEYCSSLQNVTIPSTLSEIKRHAFFGCTSLTDLKFMLPSTVKTIGPSAFSGCTALSKVTLPASVQSISEDAFENCSKLSDIIILTGVNSNVTIGNGAFEGCTGLKVFNVPDSVTTIGSHAFWNCTSLNKVYFPDNYNQALLSSDVFEGCPRTLTLVSGKTSNVIIYAANHGIKYNYRTGAISNIVIESTEMTWSGNKRKPAVLGVYDADGQMLGASDYNVSYTNCKNVGYAAVTVSAKDGSYYYGSAAAYYKIKPRSVKFTKKNTANKSITLKWNKRSEADGYYLQYSRYSDFRSSSATTRTKTIKSNKTLSRTITSLKKGKNYYVRIRAYKAIGAEKICSDWSRTVKIKVK